MSDKDVFDSEDINRDKYNTDPELDDIVDYSFREEGLPVVRVCCKAVWAPSTSVSEKEDASTPTCRNQRRRMVLLCCDLTAGRPQENASKTILVHPVSRKCC